MNPKEKISHKKHKCTFSLSSFSLTHSLSLSLSLLLSFLYTLVKPPSLSLSSLSLYFAKRVLDFKLNISFILVSSRIRA